MQFNLNKDMEALIQNVQTFFPSSEDQIAYLDDLELLETPFNICRPRIKNLYFVAMAILANTY